MIASFQEWRTLKEGQVPYRTDVPLAQQSNNLTVSPQTWAAIHQLYDALESDPVVPPGLGQRMFSLLAQLRDLAHQEGMQRRADFDRRNPSSQQPSRPAPVPRLPTGPESSGRPAV